MTKEETDLIIAEQNKSKEEILKAVAKVKSDYHELCKLKDMQIADLKAQIGKMKCNTSNIANEILDEWCRNKDDYCPHLKKLEKENAEAKEIINAFLDFEASAMERGCYIADDTRRRAEDFIKE